MYELNKEALISDKKRLEKELEEGDFNEELRWLKENKIQYLNEIIEKGNNDPNFNWRYYHYNWQKNYLAKAIKPTIDKLEGRVSTLEKEITDIKESAGKQIEELNSQLKQERVIHEEAMKNMDKWYREKLMDDIVKKLQEKNEKKTQVLPKK